MSRHDTATVDDFLRLHVRDLLAADGTPVMAERFLSRLDHCLAATRGTREDAPAAQPLTLDEGLARLAREYPALATAVNRCCVQGLTLRVAAADLGVCHRTVRERMVAGVAQLVIWTEIPETSVMAALRHLSTNRVA